MFIMYNTAMCNKVHLNISLNTAYDQLLVQDSEWYIDKSMLFNSALKLSISKIQHKLKR